MRDRAVRILSGGFFNCPLYVFALLLDIGCGLPGDHAGSKSSGRDAGISDEEKPFNGESKSEGDSSTEATFWRPGVKDSEGRSLSVFYLSQYDIQKHWVQYYDGGPHILRSQLEAQLVRLDVSTGRRQVLSQRVTAFAVSPDCRDVLASSWVDESLSTESSWWMDEIRDVSENHASTVLPVPGGFNTQSMRWSPRGGHVALAGHANPGQIGVYLLNPLTGQIDLIFQPRNRTGEPCDGHIGSPAWSPDGSTVGIKSLPIPPHCDGVEQILLYDVNERRLRPALDNLDPWTLIFDGYRPITWSPSGNFVAFNANNPTEADDEYDSFVGWNTVLVNLANGRAESVVEKSLQPKFAPEGMQLGFLKDDRRGTSFYVIKNILSPNSRATHLEYQFPFGETERRRWVNIDTYQWVDRRQVIHVNSTVCASADCSQIRHSSSVWLSNLDSGESFLLDTVHDSEITDLEVCVGEGNDFQSN
ncbi:MAG: hypothetical protein HYT87_04965 [Nitrospirae bacterium]|nr:hypothetical protein [Nitrospirota bacterium]